MDTFYIHFRWPATFLKMAKATGIDHIAIYFSDIKKAKEFFVECFGMKVKYEFTGEIFLQVGEQVLALFKGKVKEQSINHLALKVDNFEEVKKQLEKKGHKIYKGDMVNGPEGLRIQIIQ